MNKLLTFVLAAMAFVACTQNDVEELSANRNELPETLTVGFEGGDTRIELNNALKSVWSKGDEVSVFYRSYENLRYAYNGETGERMGELTHVSGNRGEQSMDNSIVVYPYSDSYAIDADTHAVEASLPAVQSYKERSYGTEGNVMVAESEFTQFVLKSVCGWLRVELTGEGEVVESVKVCGNDGEQVAGLVYINAADASIALAGSEVEESLVATEVVLNCGDGVELGAEATAFYIALLPQTFEHGMTLKVNYANGNYQTLVCENSITIRRNHISPINIEANEEAEIPTNQLWYTATALVKPYKSSAFNVAIVSNEWDEATGEGIITFDRELTTIGDYAFSGCGSLTSVTIPDSVTTIGEGVFERCSSLTSVTIPDSVTTIGEVAFRWCRNLTSVTIPDSVTTIGDWAFDSCSSLTSVTIPDSVTTIGVGVFVSCHSLAEFNGKFAADGGRCLVKDNTIIAYAEASGATYTIPDSVTTIGDYAFYECDSLTSVTIPDSVTTIGGSAFEYCRSLTSVVIPDSVTTIGDEAFYRCESLTSVTIGDSVTTIGDKAFYWCSSLKSVTIGNSVTTIGDGAFSGCESLTSVTIPDRVTTIGPGVFERCSSLTSVTIPDSVTTIEDSAFYGCDSLTSVTIPDSVTTIGNYAFCYCRSLTSVTIPDSVTTIGGYAFSDCSSLTSVTIPDRVTTIGVCAFQYCYSLTSVTIPDSVTTIGVDAFLRCGSLRSVTIGNSVTTIGGGAFYDCDSLTSVTIPDSVTTIGYAAFYECNSLTSVTIGDSVTTIGYAVFYECSSLTSVYCKAITPPTLGYYVFDYNKSGRKIYVPAESLEAYKAAENWSEYADYIVGYNFE